MKRLSMVFLIALAMVFANVAMADVIFGPTGLTAAGTNPSPAGSSGLGPLGAVGGIGGPIGFTMPFDGIFTLFVEDCCIVGDVYQVFIDGVDMGFTSPVPLNGPTPSSGTFTLALTAGAHTYDINDQIISYVGSPDPYGGGDVTANFDPAGLSVTGSATPEPATLGLLGLGLLLVGVRRYRKA